MSNANVHVVPRGDLWAVLREGSERDSSHHYTQADAIESGRATARREGVEFFIHGTDGRIRARDSYGNDSFPPRG